MTLRYWNCMVRQSLRMGCALCACRHGAWVRRLANGARSQATGIWGKVRIGLWCWQCQTWYIKTLLLYCPSDRWQLLKDVKDLVVVGQEHVVLPKDFWVLFIIRSGCRFFCSPDETFTSLKEKATVDSQTSWSSLFSVLIFCDCPF